MRTFFLLLLSLCLFNTIEAQHAKMGSIASSRVVAGGSYDANAQTFFTNVPITDNTQKTAVNQLVLDLKAAGIWTKFLAIYPFVGGTASTHKFNLKDPQDTDGAYRLVFSGGITHSATGADWNGSTGYADTKLVPTTAGLTSSTGNIAYYTRETGLAASTAVEMGATASNNSQINISIRYSGDLFGPVYTDGASFPTSSNSASNGLYGANRTATNTEGYKNGVRGVNSAIGGATVNMAIYLGAMNNIGSPAFFSNKECQFACIGNSTLTTTEATALYNAVLAFETTLSRN